MKTHKAKLKNGKIVAYDLAHSGTRKDMETFVGVSLRERLTYLGQGTVYSIDGKRQGNSVKGHFWSIDEPKPLTGEREKIAHKLLMKTFKDNFWDDMKGIDHGRVTTQKEREKLVIKSLTKKSSPKEKGARLGSIIRTLVRAEIKKIKKKGGKNAK